MKLYVNHEFVGEGGLSDLDIRVNFKRSYLLVQNELGST